MTAQCHEIAAGFALAMTKEKGLRYTGLFLSSKKKGPEGPFSLLLTQRALESDQKF